MPIFCWWTIADDDEDVVCVTKKRKNSHHVVSILVQFFFSHENSWLFCFCSFWKIFGVQVESKKTNANPVAVVDLEDKDDDWLPSPPKVKSNVHKKIEKDSTLKNLRLTAIYSY